MKSHLPYYYRNYGVERLPVSHSAFARVPLNVCPCPISVCPCPIQRLPVSHSGVTACPPWAFARVPLSGAARSAVNPRRPARPP